MNGPEFEAMNDLEFEIVRDAIKIAKARDAIDAKLSLYSMLSRMRRVAEQNANIPNPITEDDKSWASFATELRTLRGSIR